MKKWISFALVALLLVGCGSQSPEQPLPSETAPVQTEVPAAPTGFSGEIALSQDAGADYVSRFSAETQIVLSDDGITVDGGSETDTVYTSRDIIYYENKDTYESGNPYGEGEAADKHTAEEAAAHTVVNIVSPGAYRITGKLSAGQIRINLGAAAYDDPSAVVELILQNADITCTVAPAILFQNVYECDNAWSADTAKAQVDTSAAGANLILQGENKVDGSYVAKIYRDKEGEKKLWKQDGAIYSYISMIVFGPGKLDLTAANEGLDTELHLTIQGGDIAIRAGNDGINTNEDGVSVTTINGGRVYIMAGLGQEGDGIDSNGYLVINGGTVVSSAHPAADAGLDSDLGSFIHGGTVLALGSTMDWAESESGQVTMNLQFAKYQTSDTSLAVSREDGTLVFAYNPSADEIMRENIRQYQGAILSCPGLVQGENYLVYTGGELSGQKSGGLYTSVTDYVGGIQMAYTGTDVMRFPGGFGGMGNFGGFEGGRPDKEFSREDLPENFGGQMPEGFDPSQMPEGFGGQMPEGFGGERPQFSGGEMPEGMEGFPGGQRPEGIENFPGGQRPEGMEGFPGGEMPQGMGNFFGGSNAEAGTPSTVFYMSDTVNSFSGVTAAN